MAGKRLTPIARKLRRALTDAERLLWSRLRFWNHDVLANLDGVLAAIMGEVEALR